MKNEFDEILCNVFDCDIDDLQLNITLNPDKDRILKAMEISYNLALKHAANEVKSVYKKIYG